MKLLSFDLETDRLAEPGSGVPLGISCAGIAYSDQKDHTFFMSPEGSTAMTPEQVDALIDMLAEAVNDGYKIITWNGLAFDFPILASNAGKYGYHAMQMAWFNHIDMMLLVTFQRGHWLSLDAALVGAELETKRHVVTLSTGEIITDMSGARVPELWAKNERQAVIDYLAGDIAQPLELANVIEQSGGIRWISRKGYSHFVSTPLLAVNEAYKVLPFPEDVSWMESPINRVDYFANYKSVVAEIAARLETA